ncbi:aminotransferase class V-fold PLP-dependent enzyme, partial [bacterium]|nr:aminotransferase class V-fold PLP-dependent enzyme [bacterium]
PEMVGGFQELSRRPGTEAVALAAGMATALEIWQAQQDEYTDHVCSLRDRFEQQLTELAAPLVINGQQAERLPNTSNITFPGVEGEALLIALDLEGVCCSLGSACASGSVEPSPVLLAMGIETEAAKSSMRFSLHRELTEDEIDEACRRIAAAVNRLRQ